MSTTPRSLTLIGSAKYRPFRNVWFLEELGVPYAHVAAHPHTPEARSSNPFGKIPALRDGDFVMFESAAINTYLGDALKSSMVPPAGTQERGRYEQVVHTIVSELDAQGLWVHRKHDALKQMFGAMPDAVAAAKKHAKRTIDILARDNLAPNGFILGPEFSAADVLFVHCLDWAADIGWAADMWEGGHHDDPPGSSSHLLSDYIHRCHARPAYVRAKAKD